MQGQSGLLGGGLMRLARASLCAIALAAMMAQGAWAREPFVRSRDGRLWARPVPETAWCGDVVDVRLEGKPGVFSDDPEFAQKFVGGARAAVTAECPKAVAIRFHAREADRVVYRGWSSKTGGWKILQLQRADAGAAADSALREIAHVEAMRLDALAGAREVKFASEAEAGPAHAAWAISNVSLGLTIAAAPEAPAVGVADQVEALAAQAAKSCPSAEASVPSAAAGAARHTFVCREGSEPYAWGLVAWDNGGRRFQLALWEPAGDGDKGANLTAVASAFEKIVEGDW